VKSDLRIRCEGGEGSEEFLLGFGSVDAKQKIDEGCGLGFAGAGDDGFGENFERGGLLRGQEKRFAILGGEMSVGGVE